MADNPGNSNMVKKAKVLRHQEHQVIQLVKKKKQLNGSTSSKFLELLNVFDVKKAEGAGQD